MDCSTDMIRLTLVVALILVAVACSNYKVTCKPTCTTSRGEPGHYVVLRQIVYCMPCN